MKVVILAGGLGSRLSEETILKPKPMVEIGGMPIIWHIMKHYSQYGFKDFVICTGYKGEVIKDFFLKYHLFQNDFSLKLSDGSFNIITNNTEDWNITFIDSGKVAETAERLKSVRNYIGSDESFAFTYGDGVSNIDFDSQFHFHQKHDSVVTMTGVSVPNRYGTIEYLDNKVKRFVEKPEETTNLINGGFFILRKTVFGLMQPDEKSWEAEVLPRLAEEQQISVFKHSGFWHAMDTVRDRDFLESQWASGNPPWKVWV
jgi:glucose-1-phosphate cytidylyltransferase